MLALALACGAATTVDNRYKGVAPGEPAASIEFVKGYDRPNSRTSVNQAYSFVRGPYCTINRVVDLMWVDPKSRSFPMPAGQPITVEGTTTYTWTDLFQPTSVTHCASRASFTPIEGHSYVAVQDSQFVEHRCQLRVTDAATGARPPDIQFQEAAVCPVAPEKVRSKALSPDPAPTPPN